MLLEKAVIGIVAKHYIKKGQRLDTFIRDELEQAVFDNGAVAIGILPPNEDKTKAKDNWSDQLTTQEKHNLYAQIALCDGIILQGGGFSDEYECFIAKFCYDYDIPILGICAGKHNLIRAVGGSIERLDNDTHQSEDDYVHAINIDVNSRFYQIVKKENIIVNSRHKFHGTSFGPLKVVATSPDMVDEVCEDVSKKFYVGVQFHPESMYKFDENMNNIFVSFIKTCLKNKENKSFIDNKDSAN